MKLPTNEDKQVKTEAKVAEVATKAAPEKEVYIKTTNPKEFYLLTRPMVEGEWRPTVEVVSADDPRLADTANVMVLAK